LTQDDPQDAESVTSHDGPNTPTTPDVSSIRIPESTPRQAANKKSKTPLFLGGGIGAVALLATGMILGHASAGNRTPAPNTPTASVAEEDQGAAVVPPVATSEATALPGKNAGTTKDALVQTTSIEAMKEMDLKDFAKLSLPDRAAFAYTMATDIRPAGPNYTLQPMLVVGYWQDLLGAAASSTDKLTGEKVVSAIEYNAFDSQTGELSGTYQAYVKLVDQIRADATSHGGGFIVNDIFAYEGHGSTQVDPLNGKTYTDITYRIVDNSGATMSPTATVEVFQDQVRLLNGEIITVFSKGAGVLGTDSPVPSNPY